MLVRIIMSGLGISIPKTEVGIDLISGCYIQIKNTPHDSAPWTYAIATFAEAGNKSGTLVLGHVETDWFFVENSKYKWLSNKEALMGKIAEVELEGTLIARGTVNVRFTILDDEGEVIHKLTKIDRSSGGVQIASTKVHGILKLIPSKKLITP